MLNHLVDLNIVDIKTYKEDIKDIIFLSDAFIFTKTNVSVIVNNTKFVLDNKKILFVEKGQRVSFLAMDHCFVININGAIVKKLFNTGKYNKVISYIDTQSTNIMTKLEEIISIYNTFNKNNLFLIGLFYQVLYSIDLIVNKTEKNNYSSYVSSAIIYINEHLADDITIIDVATYCGVHPNYLSKLFQEELKMSTKSYIIDVKMEHAKKLLFSKMYTISQISKKVGFKNQLYFSKAFKKYYGCSPTQYLKDN